MAAKLRDDPGPRPHDVRDYIEAMLDELAELAGRSAELRVATILRHAALHISRLEQMA